MWVPFCLLLKQQWRYATKAVARIFQIPRSTPTQPPELPPWPTPRLKMSILSPPVLSLSSPPVSVPWPPQLPVAAVCNVRVWIISSREVDVSQRTHVNFYGQLWQHWWHKIVSLSWYIWALLQMICLTFFVYLSKKFGPLQEINYFLFYLTTASLL